VINAVKDKSAWEVPVLGSDFDGVINHVEFYNDASKLPDLQKDLVQQILQLLIQSQEILLVQLQL
jgi:microsomal dipeptidase-like Zn-dependent dipeptidase